MRLVNVKAPQGQAQAVVEIAHRVGIPQATVYPVESHGQGVEPRETVEVETSSPKAKAFVEALMAAPFFDPETYPIAVRGLHARVSAVDVADLTKPVALPSPEVVEELWQFSHVTFSLVGRFICAGLLLAYGMLQDNLLLVIAGLLFMPLLPMFMAMGLGGGAGHWRLARQGLRALLISLALLVITGVLVALLAREPLRFERFSPLPVGFLLTLIVGVASTLASADNVGRRELIGLAAASQVGIVPVWLGIALVLGPAELAHAPERLLGLAVNSVTLAVVTGVVYTLMGVRSDTIHRWTHFVTRRKEQQETSR